MERIPTESTLGVLLDWCHTQDASDLHARAGQPFFIRVHGELKPVPGEVMATPGVEQLDEVLREAFSSEVGARIRAAHEFDLSFYLGERRYRANFSKQRGLQSFSLRAVPQQRLKLRDLQLPVSLKDIPDVPRGLVLVTGPTGQGKSTTVRALIQEINETRALRIVTIEDPIEYVFTDRLAQFEQREVGIDTASFADGIRNAMRQDPNVIFIGEIRDRESIWAALQASETGHLVLTTLHADSVPQAIGRIREFFPASEQPNISGILARNLNSVINQRLLPNVHGTRTPCLEIMKRDAGVHDAVAANDLTLLSGIIEASVTQGMHTFDQYLTELLAAGVITEATARYYAVNKHRLDMTLRGIRTTRPILVPD
jgi:twitching motility protein PilT